MSEPGLGGSPAPSVLPSVNGHCALGTRSALHLTPLMGAFQEKYWRAWGNASLVDGEGSPEKIFAFFFLPPFLICFSLQRQVKEECGGRAGRGELWEEEGTHQALGMEGERWGLEVLQRCWPVQCLIADT